MLNPVQPQFEQFVAAVGCQENSLQKTMSCLRKASVSALARAQDAVSDFNVTVYVLHASLAQSILTRICSPYNIFTPVIDGKVITQNPTKSILEGKFHKVSLMVGCVFHCNCQAS